MMYGKAFDLTEKYSNYFAPLCCWALCVVLSVKINEVFTSKCDAFSETF